MMLWKHLPLFYHLAFTKSILLEMSGGQGNPYSLEERRAILQVIIENNAFHRVKSHSFWKEVEDKFERHTWQSLRDHFKKQLFPNIHHSYYNLTPEQIQQFREGWIASLQRKRKQNQIPQRSEASKQENYIVCILEISLPILFS
ncbi:hypothetical protein Trydic_g17038 [Trypoxylus dichotomus]